MPPKLRMRGASQLYPVLLVGVAKWLRAPIVSAMTVSHPINYFAPNSSIFNIWESFKCKMSLNNRIDYDIATQRMCVQRGPSDSEDRCAYTVYNHKKVFMCFCQGDLCNTAPKSSTINLQIMLLLPLLPVLLASYRNR